MEDSKINIKGEIGREVKMRIFEVIDKSGRQIHLSDKQLKHIVKHPEMQEKTIVERIQETVKNPNTIISDKYNLNKHVYYRYYKDQKQYLLVSVKYLNGEGFIITSFYTDKIQQ